MSRIDFMQIGLYFLALLLLTPLLGAYMAKVFAGQRHLLSWALGPLERLIYRVAWVNPNEQMCWKKYTRALVVFSLYGLVATFLMQLFQGWAPFNPQKLDAVSWPLAFNTAVSFVTNTNWQAYAGENTLSYFTQALGLSVQNFVSAASGMAVLLVLIRGLLQKELPDLGNFWVDITRAVLYVLLPLSLLLALVLISQGVLQNCAAYVQALTMEGASQLLPMGPVASQEAIKQLGTNGGGFLGVNSAHPFENPTGLANFFEMVAILLIPSALVYTFGVMTKALKHAAAIYFVMSALLCSAVFVSAYQELGPNKTLDITQNMEGKETRLGMTNSVIWAMATTAASNGSVNAMHDSLSPLSGGIALLQMLLGEVIFGGVGAGLYGMLLFVMLTVFLSGLMIGRTPEYFGKKIEAFEIQLVLLAILLPCAVVLIGSALTIMVPQALKSLGNQGPHGLSEILYAWGSAANNNGSAFGGLNVTTDFYNLALAVAMLLGRFGVIVPVLAIAGSLAVKRISPKTQGTFETHGLSFVLLLLSVILIVGALTFMPALVLGPVVEYFLMNLGMSY